MRYATPEAFRAALDQRLKNHAAQTGIPLVRLRKTIAFDRFLARLVAVASDRWVLKGALALDFRLGSGTRTTKDIDLGRLRLTRPRAGLPRPGPASPAHAPLSAAHQRESRALHPHAARRLGLRGYLRQLPATNRRALHLARPLRMKVKSTWRPGSREPSVWVLVTDKAKCRRQGLVVCRAALPFEGFCDARPGVAPAPTFFAGRDGCQPAVSRA